MASRLLPSSVVNVRLLETTQLSRKACNAHVQSVSTPFTAFVFLIACQVLCWTRQLT